MAKLKSSGAPTAKALTERARDLIPILKARAVEAETLRRIPDETIADLRDAGLHCYFTPKRYGGWEMDWPVQYEIGRHLAQGCGSTAWIGTVVLGNTWLAGRFEKAAQDEVWADGNGTIISSAFAGGNKMEKVDGGYRLDGLWRFSSGVDHADWVVLGASVANYKPQEEAGPPEFRLALVPRTDIEIIDNWYANGLKGTGSKDIRVRDVVVPAYRTLVQGNADAPPPPGAALHESYIYGAEFLPYFRSLLIGPMIGGAIGAATDYLEMTKPRIGNMFGESIVDQVPIQIRIAESALELRSSELMAEALIAELHDVGRAGSKIVGVNRINQGRDTAYIARQCRASADRLAQMMGATGQTGNNPVHRHFRDVSAMASHGSIQWDKTVSPYGKWALGVPTGDPNVDNA
jgi:3-hydroxy-9,10-secoandrosta-1,3,5(10)-triene-9,17-dione monooxygenase